MMKGGLHFTGKVRLYSSCESVARAVPLPVLGALPPERFGDPLPIVSLSRAYKSHLYTLHIQVLLEPSTPASPTYTDTAHLYIFTLQLPK